MYTLEVVFSECTLIAASMSGSTILSETSSKSNSVISTRSILSGSKTIPQSGRVWSTPQSLGSLTNSPRDSKLNFNLLKLLNPRSCCLTLLNAKNIFNECNSCPHVTLGITWLSNMSLSFSFGKLFSSVYLMVSSVKIELLADTCKSCYFWRKSAGNSQNPARFADLSRLVECILTCSSIFNWADIELNCDVKFYKLREVIRRNSFLNFIV